MFRLPPSRSLAALAVAAILCGPVLADPSPIRDAELSMRLFQRGLEDGNPILILAAAEIRKAMDFVPKTGSAGTDARGPITWQQMLDAAHELAIGDDALLGLIEDVAADSSKGVTTGQVYSISAIGEGHEDVYEGLPFDAGKYAEVYVESADGSDLNLYIYDAAGRLVCSDTDVSSISYCGWRPSEAGSFTIKVENKGLGAADYSLMTN